MTLKTGREMWEMCTVEGSHQALCKVSMRPKAAQGDS